jgi:energy-coupling factor transporter transmembrane protein EcfT
VNLYLLHHPQSWLSNLDGRTKLAVFFVYVLAVLSTKPGAYLAWLSLTGLLLVLLALARLQIRWIAFRLAPVLPFVALGAFGVLLGGSKEMFLQVTVKMLLCVGAAVWLSGTTPFTQLLEAFRKLKVPPYPNERKPFALVSTPLIQECEPVAKPQRLLLRAN